MSHEALDRLQKSFFKFTKDPIMGARIPRPADVVSCPSEHLQKLFYEAKTALDRYVTYLGMVALDSKEHTVAKKED